MDLIEFDYANDIPSSPDHYQFTYQQKVQIERFFHEKKYLTSPVNFNLDLYHAAIVAIRKCTHTYLDLWSDDSWKLYDCCLFLLVPINGSNALRRLIEALFITQTQAQLNSDGHLDTFLFPDTTINHHPIKLDSSQQQPQQKPWCEHLARHPFHESI